MDERDTPEAGDELGRAVEDVEQRWRDFHRLSPLTLLGIGVLLAVATNTMFKVSDTGWYAMVGLVAGAAVLEGIAIRAGLARKGPSVAGTVYYGLRWALAFGLAWINPLFAFYAAIGYFGADRFLLPRLVKFGLAASAVILAGSQSGGLPPENAGQWAFFGALYAINMALVAAMVHLDSKERERTLAQVATIAELEHTNRALQDALDENAALQAQLLVQAREAGVSDERRRLAAEIHDTIAQGLTGIIAQLQVVANTPDQEQAREHLDRAADLARHSLGEARRSVHNLAPAALDDATLAEALKKTVADWSARTGVRADFTLTGTAEPLHEEIGASLLRIAEEALSNAARHAAATRVGVTLSFMAGEVTLDVRDDGRGFDPLSVPARSGAGGFGLDGMRARAERLAGGVTVESEEGGGTAISARVPLVRHD
ncbi:sensor histidine kinase [Streptomyces sp. NBC_01016]|uniref:sensor histidine kinase n=1 Tax=Streptomyces sp. NBC_01016 TaxID=2903720 RepID=UPI002255EA4D|nr:sensor histidine kinase [Streptomyces sp. NBC_01016]MCX4829445.1 sensor histidine kinase [Streptomyces sp. NBC_01016]